MTFTGLTRRTLMVSALGVAGASRLLAETGPVIHVSKDAGCPCCADWIDYLRAVGFAVTEAVLEADALAALKGDLGIPLEAQSCHTGVVEGYALEGHVPVADIRRLLAERPDAVGIAVPGMPFGSPGMGPESRREAYDVLLVRKDGATEVFATYAAA